MGVILIFPRSKDRAFVRRQATWLANHRSDAGEKYLARLIADYAKRLETRGARSSAIANELKSLEGAVRAEASRLNLVEQGGVA